MKKNILTLSQFGRLCEERGFTRYQFSVNDQCNADICGPCFSCVYKIVSIFLQPNTVVFNSQDAKLYFKYVKYIQIMKDDSEKGLVFDVVCKENAFEDNEKRFTLFAA